MTWADWAIVGVLVLSALISIKRGFVKEALSLATWVAAVIIAIIFADRLAVLLEDYIATPSVREMAAFALLFVATLLVGAMVSYLIGALVRVTGLTGTDRLLGMLFGLARGFVIVMALLIFLPGIIPVDQDPWWQESNLIVRFLEFENWARSTTSQVVKFFSDLFNS
jgi:membrane protein required for colicin V production